MDASLSPYPLYSWLSYSLAIRSPRLFAVHRCRHVAHRILITVDGEAEVTVSTHAAAVRIGLAADSIGYLPADDDDHVFSITSINGYAGHVICVPRNHLSRHPRGTGALTSAAAHHDPSLAARLHRMTAAGVGRGRDPGNEDGAAEARRAVIRLAELLSLPEPAWPAEHSVFPPPAMRQLVGAIDSSLYRSPSLRGLCSLVGLSPSHFARKFQHSAGLSLNRFLNHRRIRQSLDTLRDTSRPLSQVALDLGFSSQSHFTRLFGDLTGMTPNQFRRLPSGRRP